MFVITVSKRMAAIAAAVVVLIAVGTFVLLARSDGSKQQTASAASEGSPTCAPTTPATTTETAAATETTTAPSNGSYRRGGSSIAVESSPYYPTLMDAVAATVATDQWRYDVTAGVADTTITASGAIDLPSDSVDVVAQTSSASSQFRRVGDTIFVNARRLGATGTTWVAVDSESQTSQVAGRAVRSIVSSLSPNYLMAALHYPSSIEQAENDAFGAHFRVGITGPASNLLPLLDIFGTPTDPSAPVVDVWINNDGHVSRIAFTTDQGSTVYSLHDFGQVAPIEPPSSDVSDVNSTSGTFLFGPALPLSTQGVRATQTVSTHALTIAPSVEIDDGIVRGALHATSATGEQMRYVFIGSGSGGKLDLGTVTNGPLAGPQSFTALPYANWLDGQSKGVQSFDVRVRESTEVFRRLAAMPFIGSIAQPVVDRLQDTPALADRLASIIGIATTTRINADVNTLAPDATPLAFTYQVTSFDGTKISTNFFPASGLSAGNVAPLALMGNALGAAGTTNPYMAQINGVVPGPAYLRSAQAVGDVAFDVITWDPRGTFASGGILQLDNPFYEGRDLSAIIDFAASSTPTTLNGPNDPAVGMVGASYGGSIQLVVGSNDPRVDAMVPVAAVNSLVDTLQPYDLVNSSAASTLLAALNSPNVRASDQIKRGLADAIRTGQLSEATRALLAPNTVTPLLQQTQVPSLLLQSTTDPFLPLSESVANAQSILANPYGTPVKMAWFDINSADANVAQTLMTYSKAWLSKYVAGVPIPDAFTPTFQWWDQNGTRSVTSANVYPFSPGFNSNTPLQSSSAGGTLTINPAGGAVTSIPLSIAVPPNSRIVGAASVTFTYRGTGSAATVFARIIDPSTGRPVSASAQSIPVILDGQSHTVSVPMDFFVFTSTGGGSLAFELMSAATGYPTPTAGEVSVSNLVVAVPTIA